MEKVKAWVMYEDRKHREVVADTLSQLATKLLDIYRDGKISGWGRLIYNGVIIFDQGMLTQEDIYRVCTPAFALKSLVRQIKEQQSNINMLLEKTKLIHEGIIQIVCGECLGEGEIIIPNDGPQTKVCEPCGGTGIVDIWTQN